MDQDQKPRKPRSAYMHFVQEHRPDLMKEFPIIPFDGIGNILATEWANLNPDEMKVYEGMAASERAEYETKLYKIGRSGKFKVKKLHPDAKLPSKMSAEAAGYDLYSNSDDVILAGTRKLIKTNVAVQIPLGCYGKIESRSSLAMKGIDAEAEPDIKSGVIDSDYRGDVGILLHNTSSIDFPIKKHDRIAQMIIMECKNPEVIEVDELTDTQRGSGGYGSTGV